MHSLGRSVPGRGSGRDQGVTACHRHQQCCGCGLTTVAEQPGKGAPEPVGA